jgi:hypothetical protein
MLSGWPFLVGKFYCLCRQLATYVVWQKWVSYQACVNVNGKTSGVGSRKSNAWVGDVRRGA